MPAAGAGGVPAGDDAGACDQPGGGRDGDAGPQVAAAVPADSRQQLPQCRAGRKVRAAAGGRVLPGQCECFRRGDSAQQPRQAGQVDQLVATVGAVREVTVDDASAAGIEGTKHVDRQLQADLAATAVAAHGPGPASVNALPIPASTFGQGSAVQLNRYGC